MHTINYDQWYYLIYLLPGGAALLTLLVSAVSGGHHHRGHAVVHAGHDAGHAGGGIHLHHGGHTAGAHTSHAAPSAHAAAPTHAATPHATAHGLAHSAHQPGHNAVAKTDDNTGVARTAPGGSILLWFGVGRVPAPFVWCSLLLGWSLFGFWTTRGLQDIVRYPALFILPALAAGVVGALAGARLSAVTIGRIMPADESQDLSTAELIGLQGTAAFAVGEEHGRVHVYDQYRTMHDCTARVAKGQATIERGRSVMVLDYDPDRDQLIVEEIA
jgi:hypothetical protein